MIEDFIGSRVISHGLDERMEKAYRLDLEHFMSGADQKGTDNLILREKRGFEIEGWEEWMEAYSGYLNKERKPSFSTLYWKNKVLGYYLSYLVKQGIILGCRTLKLVTVDKRNKDMES